MNKPKKSWVKWLTLAITLGILTVIYLQVDPREIAKHFANMRVGWFLAALCLFPCQFAVTALRWRTMTRCVCQMSFVTSFNMTMAGKALNALLPSKIGEMSKAWFLSRDTGASMAQSVALATLEKVFDLGGLSFLLLIGSALYSKEAPAVWVGLAVAACVVGAVIVLLVFPLTWLAGIVRRIHPKLEKVAKLLESLNIIFVHWKARPFTLVAVLFLSVLLWGLHVTQIYLIFPTLNQDVPVLAGLALIPIAILIGLLPLTVAGMGTRDSALIYLFAPLAAGAATAGVGLFCSLRYLVDTIAGIPFFHYYNRRAQERPAPKPA